MKTNKTESEWLQVKAGNELTFDVLTWQHEGYTFGRPCLMLSPVLRENSDSHPECMIETACIDAVVTGRLLRNSEQRQIEWRGWNVAYLKRCFLSALAGKEFPVAGYCATRKRVRFLNDKKCELTFEYVD